MSIDTSDPEFQRAVEAAVARALAEREERGRAAAKAAAEKADAEAARRAEAEAEARDEQAQEARRWEGHTHTWGAESDGFAECGDCGMRLPVEIVEGDGE